MPLLQSIETVKEDIAGVLQVGSEQVPLSQKELLLFGILRLILGGLGGTGGGGGSVSIDNEALAGAIANALELKTLTVSGDTVNETVLAAAIAANTQPISASSLPLPADASTETTLSGIAAKLPSALVGDRLKVDNSGVTQPISAASLPLPTGAATEATLSGLSAKLPPALVSGRLSVDGSAATQPISATSLPLPSGAATENTLTGLSAKLPSALVSDRLKVDGSGVTQPISASSLPLPSGAATSAKQPAIGVAGTPSADVISVQGVASGTPQPISATALPLPSGAATETTLSGLSAKLPTTLVSGRLSVDGSGVTQPVSASSLPLPTGAATSAKQPSLGTAGTPSTDVISVQGIASGVALPASQSGTWQFRLQDGAGNVITSQASGAQRAIDTQILLSGSVIDPRSIRALTTSDIISFASISKRVSATFTRPADTTTYAAGDAMGSSTSTPTVLTFANSARVSAGTGMITKARLVKNSTNTTNSAFRLWLFSSSPTGANDNAAFALAYSSVGSRLGYIDFPGFVTEGTGSDCAECEVIGLASQFYASATSLFGVLVARSAYAPTSGEQFFVELALEQN